MLSNPCPIPECSVKNYQLKKKKKEQWGRRGKGTACISAPNDKKHSIKNCGCCLHGTKRKNGKRQQEHINMDINARSCKGNYDKSAAIKTGEKNNEV